MESTETTVKNLLKGGEFLIKDMPFSDTFTPEDLNEEQKMIIDTTVSFIDTEVLPVYDRIEKQEPGLTESLLEKAGELGLLGLAIPEEYGGMGKDFNTNSLLVEYMAKSRSFSLSLGAHIGIGTLPIVYFGNEAQKAHYLPKLASGELKACYCLTEPGSGSDALGAKTTAILNPEGTHYIVNGQKMWITNSGFADVFIVFVQVGGDKFSGLIMEKGMEGLSLGAEEKKMGIKGSSTRQVFFENVKVPVENLLGEVGKGHLIAFNILNVGRYKLAAGVLGASKMVIEQSAQYAVERQQFKKPIATFGAIQYKLAEMTTRTYALQSAVYRAADAIDNKEKELMAEGKSVHEAIMKAAEEYAIECSIVKFFGSEVLNYCVDENVQIHGGMGYSEELGAAPAYRDARTNRIFEGTNEINRLLTVDMLMKRAMSGKIDLMTPGMAIQKELMSVPDFSADESNDVLAGELKAIKNLKKAVLLVAGGAAQKLMAKLKDEQEILMNAADMMAELYVIESSVLRTQKLIADRGEAACALQIDMTKVYTSDALERVFVYGKHALQSFAEGDELRIMLMGLKRFTKYEPFNTKDARRRIAAKVLEEGKYCF